MGFGGGRGGGAGVVFIWVTPKPFTLNGLVRGFKNPYIHIVFLCFWLVYFKMKSAVFSVR